MKGKDFRAGILLDERSVCEISELMSISRGYLHVLFSYAKVPDKFVLRAKSFGIVFPVEKTEALEARIKELEAQLDQKLRPKTVPVKTKKARFTGLSGR